MKVNYDGIEWDVEETPVGSSTPDDQFEQSYRARGRCTECGSEIIGEANYWSRNEDGSNASLNNVDYKPCEH